jgi:hypothetical protein
MVSQAPEPLVLHFDSFAADLHTCELRKGDHFVKIQPQSFKLLVLLASRAGELVTRGEIRPSPGGATPYYSLSADNRWIYYTHVTSESDIWMLAFDEEQE